MGANSALVEKNVQVSQMDSKWQSSFGGAGAVAVAEQAFVEVLAQAPYVGALGIGGQGLGLGVERFDLVADGVVLIGDVRSAMRA